MKNILMSVIVSSYKDELFTQFCESVKHTIGCRYEIIRVENPGCYSLCEAYNIGLSRACGEYVCFIHDDVRFLSMDWGKHCISVLSEDTKIGLIGVAGCAYKSTVAGSWFSTFTYEYCRGIICQGNNTFASKRWDDFDKRLVKEDLSEVVCIDGVFMCTKIEIANMVKFDEKLFTGYHCYDLDFSTAIFIKGYRVVVDRNILLHHASQGAFNHDFAHYAWKYVWKWKHDLPLCAYDIPKRKVLYIEFRNWYSFLKHKLLKFIEHE